MSESRPLFPFQLVGGMELCPYLHRVLLTAQVAGYVAGSDFELRCWPAGETPEWLGQLARGTGSPVLVTSDGAVSGDASAASRRIAELAGSNCRSDLSHIELALLAQVDEVLLRLRGVFTAKTAQELDDHAAMFFESLRPIEQALSHQAPTAQWSLVTCAYAPVFALISPHTYLLHRPAWQQLPRVSAWQQRLAQHPHVLRSRCPSFASAFERFFRRFDSYLPNAC